MTTGRKRGAGREPAAPGPSRDEGIVQVSVRPGRTPEERDANWTEALRAFVKASPGTGVLTEIRCAADEEEARQLGLAVVQVDAS